MADNEIAAAVRLVIEAHPQGAEAGPKAILDILQALDDRFKGFGIQKFKRIFGKAKEFTSLPALPQDYAATVASATKQLNPSFSLEKTQPQPAKNGTGKGAGYSSCNEVVEVASENKENCIDGDAEVVLARPDLARKFGMMIGMDKALQGGHAITSIRQGGVLDDWNSKNPSTAIQVGDVLLSVNGKGTFDEMMKEFGQSLSCILKLARKSEHSNKQVLSSEPLKVDNSEAVKEAAEWEKRKARVTAALIPGLKKIIESEFGPGASARISRVERMYERIGQNEVYEEETELGKIYAPGFIQGLCTTPWHDTKDYSWCAELSRQWKAIRTELRNSLSEDSLWTGGAYQASNEAYGADWKIMGVFTADQWRDEKRFKVTSAAVRSLKGVKPFEVFFARMPAHTKIATHSDNLNYILTSHLALELEEGKCLFKVGSEERPWKEGEMLVVDTSYMHSCVNESDRARYVLVFRFWHPALSDEELRAIQLSHAILARASEKR